MKSVYTIVVGCSSDLLFKADFHHRNCTFEGQNNHVINTKHFMTVYDVEILAM